MTKKGILTVSSTDRGRPIVTRRRLVLSLTASIGLVAGASWLRSGARPKPPPDLFEEVTPEAGVDIGITFGDALPKLVAAGVLVPDKLPVLGGKLPGWVERVLDGNSSEPIVFSRERAPHLVNLLWPIGLANRAVFNRGSPINTADLSGFASTGGWTLGRAANGAAYFNSVDAVPLSERQAFLALAVATNTFRPCCDNSTFFQDCNHGSALLGLIELAASQGATAEALYRMALTANSCWFPEQYARTAQYFAHFENRPWRSVPAPMLVAAAYSTLSGWQRNVDAPLRRAHIAPPNNPGAEPLCGIPISQANSGIGSEVSAQPLRPSRIPTLKKERSLTFTV